MIGINICYCIAMNEYQNKVKSCVKQVKEKIKSQEINYQTIADRLNISLLTVKRQLNSEDISLSKLLALCEVSDLNFTEIWQSIDEASVVHTLINDIQDRAFYNNPHLMHFFFEMFQQKKTPEEIKQQWNLTPASLHLYLRELEKLELIQVSTQQKVSFKLKRPVGFGPNSKVIRKEISDDLRKMSRLFALGQEQEEFLLSKPLQLSDELRHKMYKELLELVSRYSELSEKYFLTSKHPVFNLVVCDYRQKKLNKLAAIINIKGFK